MNLRTKKLLSQSFSAFVNGCHAVFLIYSDDNTYEMPKANDFFQQLVPSKGSLSQLYRTIFLNGDTHKKVHIGMFKRENYRDTIEITFNDQTEYFYFRVLRIEPNVYCMYFRDCTSQEHHKRNSAEFKNYLHSIVHELRSPISAILGMNELIQSESQNEQTTRYASDIQNTGNFILELINSILDFSRIEAGKMVMTIKEYDTKQLIEEIRTITLFLSKNKNLDIIFDIDDTLPKILIGDSLRIKQVIINLLTNAVKYTPEESVTFNVSFATSNDRNEGELLVKITDTGVGIDSNDLDKLYNRFERINEEDNPDIIGTGIGMSIVHSLLDIMDSRLEVSSTLGVGSTFSFSVVQQLP